MEFLQVRGKLIAAGINKNVSKEFVTLQRWEKFSDVGTCTGHILQSINQTGKVCDLITFFIKVPLLASDTNVNKLLR